MVKIAFWDNMLTERGTTAAVLDYAYYNIHLLGNESIILYNCSLPGTVPSVVEECKRVCPVIGIPSFGDIDAVLEREHVDLLYVIKYGTNDGQVSKRVKTLVHAVFDARQPHGDLYAVVSPWIPGASSGNAWIPHIVDLPPSFEGMRSSLGIPPDAIVFGRYGGWDQFDIPYVHSTVYDVAKRCANIYFLFANTKPFCPPLPNILHIGKLIGKEEKSRFIYTCDAMLWGRQDGETFGLSIAEFSSQNKPVLCTRTGYPAHVYLLGQKGIWYTEETLYSLLTTFTPRPEKDWNAYRAFTPERVMAQFAKCVERIVRQPLPSEHTTKLLGQSLPS
jgi:hypothetical protein